MWFHDCVHASSHPKPAHLWVLGPGYSSAFLRPLKFELGTRYAAESVTHAMSSGLCLSDCVTLYVLPFSLECDDICASVGVRQEVRRRHSQTSIS